MRLASLPPSLAVFAVTLLGLTACLGSDPTLVPDPEPTTTPVFANDEEALAAAEEAYAAYIAVSDQILIDGGINPERLLEVATQEVYDTQLEGYEMLAANSWRSTGGTMVDSVQIQYFDSATVAVYACVDVSKVDVLNRDGNSVVAADRPARSAFEIFFDYDKTKLLVAGQEVWTGDDFCAASL
jgi:hypothetical protein